MQFHGKNIIGGRPWESATNPAVAAYTAVDPSTAQVLEGTFRYASPIEIAEAVKSAEDAYRHILELSPDRIPTFLRTLAARLNEMQDPILARCESETALPRTPRLVGELQRVCTFLNMYASMIDSGDVSQPAITTALPDRKPAPRSDIRMLNIGIGPIVVLEASNFPFAFGVLGNDTASAWSAGCPVIAKVHPLHPGTSELIGMLIRDTLEHCHLPAGMFSLVHGGSEETRLLVQHPAVRGVGFTGSRKVGTILRQLAAERQDPIELCLELGSVNPMFLLPGALRKNASGICEGLNSAALNAAGQFCTSPGVVFVPDDSVGHSFIDRFSLQYLAVSDYTLLGNHIAQQFHMRIDELKAVPGTEFYSTSSTGVVPCRVGPVMVVTSYDVFQRHPTLRDEAFGPAIVIIRCPTEKLAEAAQLFTGELTASIHYDQADSCDRTIAAALQSNLIPRVGRLIYNGYSPGVELCASMYHGGPWPASSSRFSAVGPDAVHRWVRRMCFQNAPNDLLPDHLKSDNPFRVTRNVDGEQLT